MTEAQATEMISVAVSASLAARGDVAVVFDNDPGALPTTGALAQVQVLHTMAATSTMGGPGTRKVKRSGWVQVVLRTPAGVGAQFALALAGLVRAALELQAFALAGDAEPVYTSAVSLQPGGNDGRWYTLLVRAPFWFMATV